MSDLQLKAFLHAPRACELYNSYITIWQMMLYFFVGSWYLTCSKPFVLLSYLRTATVLTTPNKKLCSFPQVRALAAAILVSRYVIRLSKSMYLIIGYPRWLGSFLELLSAMHHLVLVPKTHWLLFRDFTGHKVDNIFPWYSSCLKPAVTQFLCGYKLSVSRWKQSRQLFWVQILGPCTVLSSSIPQLKVASYFGLDWHKKA